ncbi:hypothetical protein JW935_24140 [candidate division KSB1 bacterium]|nr:hypothetical protein [candidate division KSB1 bacterium]
MKQVFVCGLFIVNVCLYSFPNDYKSAIQHLENQKQNLRSQWLNAGTDSAKNVILNQTQNLLLNTISQELFPPWYGTEWDFYGTTQTPGVGKIACGYFVTTILRDAGFILNRTKLAQEPSETMIKAICPNKYIQRYSNVTIKKFIQSIKTFPEGLYIVGLDCHVGFLLYQQQKVRFIHSSYVLPLCVTDEDPELSIPLKTSGYRVIGYVTNPETCRKWLENDPF